MPTGYTADIKEGITFRTFALNCARAFGACVTLRDEPGGGEVIPDSIEPDTFHAKQAKTQRDALTALEAMTPERAERAALDDWDTAETHRAVRLKENAAQQQAYAAMLEKVQAWTPPTAEHEHMKEFMVEQITTSMKFDDMGEYYAKPTERKTGAQWLAERRESITRSIDRHDREQEEENRRAAGRTAWLRALRDSLPA